MHAGMGSFEILISSHDHINSRGIRSTYRSITSGGTARDFTTGEAGVVRGISTGTWTVSLLSATKGRIDGLWVAEKRDSLEEDNSPSASSEHVLQGGVAKIQKQKQEILIDYWVYEVKKCSSLSSPLCVIGERGVPPIDVAPDA